ncbi:MAG: phospholipid carrier-dependent glycosyltransferase, partial [Bacteroidota bacterium]
MPKILTGLTILAYFLHLGLNNIWTPNESFYAEAVREMLESGNYLELFYNYEPRFNKPPLLYWLMAISASIFGLSEFAIRLPVALLGLGTVYLTYQMGRLLDGERLGILAAAVMAFSFQFVINARYGSPAVPLTFFFTLTTFLFLKGYLQRS